MVSRIITREEVAEKLRDWAAGRMATGEVLGWSTALYAVSDVDYADWEHAGHSVTNEVLGALDMLDMNMVLPADVPIFLEFLSTPAGRFQAGYTRFRGRLEAIDYEARRKELRDVLPYARFLQPARQ